MAVQKPEARAHARVDSFERIESIDLAFLDRDDFARALSLGIDFDGWTRYEDFRDERDARLIGHCTSGLLAYETGVSLACCEDWASHAHAPLSLRALDDFARLLRVFRANPEAPVDAIDGANWSRAVHDRTLDRGQLPVPICRQRHQHWLEALAQSPLAAWSSPMPDYARLLLQNWSDYSVPADLEL